MAYATACTPPATALAVGPFIEQGCERSELPCLARDDKKLGQRPWSFYSNPINAPWPYPNEPIW